MSTASRVIFTCIYLISFTGLATADDRALSDSSIIALSVLFGVILIICIFCLTCYCIRRYKFERRRKKRRQLKEAERTDTSIVDTNFDLTEVSSDENLNTEKSKHVVHFADPCDIAKDIEQDNDHEHNTSEVSDNTGVGQQQELHLETETNTQLTTSETETAVTNEDSAIRNIDTSYSNGEDLEADVERCEEVSVDNEPNIEVTVESVDNLVPGTVDITTEQFQENIEKNIQSKTKSPNMVVVQNNTVYTQAPMQQTHTVYTQNGSGPHLQRYSDWKAGTTSQSMYVKNSSTLNRSQVVDMRPRTRSISPSRYQQRGFERGRSVKRIAVPSQVLVTNPNASVRVNTINRARIRSRSAPPLRQMTYVARVPDANSYGYTQSHFLAIKQPFSKKFLLPPVRVSQRFVPTASQRVIVTKRPTVITRPQPPPPPQQQNVIKGKIYHVQYNPAGANTITRNVNALNLERSVGQTVSNGHAYYGGHQYATRQHSNTSSQGRQGRVLYTNQISQLSYNSDVFDSQGMYVRQGSGSNGYYMTEQNDYGPIVYTSRPYSHQNLVSLSEYTPKIMKTSFYEKRAQGWRHAENGTGSRPTSMVIERPTSQVIEQQTTTTTTTTKNGEADYIYSQVIKTSGKTTGKVEDEYTIVDYVEDRPTSGKTTNPLSTSTPRFAERDTSALEDLDNVLGKTDSSSSSSSDEN